MVKNRVSCLTMLGVGSIASVYHAWVNAIQQQWSSTFKMQTTIDMIELPTSTNSIESMQGVDGEKSSVVHDLASYGHSANGHAWINALRLISSSVFTMQTTGGILEFAMSTAPIESMQGVHVVKSSVMPDHASCGLVLLHWWRLSECLATNMVKRVSTDNDKWHTGVCDLRSLNSIHARGFWWEYEVHAQPC